MKKFFSLLLLTTIITNAGGDQSKLWSLVTDSPPEPFGGKSWHAVHISPSLTVYTFDKAIREWNLSGNELRECYSSKDIPAELTLGGHEAPHAYFSDNACYLINGSDFGSYSLEAEGGKKIVKMNNVIKDFSAHKTGFTVLDSTEYLTRFNLDCHDEGTPIAAKGVQNIHCMENGDIYGISEKKLVTLRAGKGEFTELRGIGNMTLLNKQLPADRLILKDRHPTIKNAVYLYLYNLNYNNTVRVDTVYEPIVPHREQNTLAVASKAGENSKGSLITLYDITTGKRTYQELVKNISGTCAIRLAAPYVYFVGDKPEPRLVSLDTRPKPESQNK